MISIILMMEKKFFGKRCYSFNEKVDSLVIGQAARISKHGNNILKKKPCCDDHIKISNILCFISLSQLVGMYLTLEFLARGFIGSMKSTIHFSKYCSAQTGCRGNSSWHDGFPTLSHSSQTQEYYLAYLNAIGHHIPICNMFLTVSFSPTCPPETPLCHSHRILGQSWSST